ncbi:MAG: hypothetical protein R2693_01720 [Nocardioidaceae bacterium]
MILTSNQKSLTPLIALASVLALALTACGSSEPKSKQADAKSVSKPAASAVATAQKQLMSADRAYNKTMSELSQRTETTVADQIDTIRQARTAVFGYDAAVRKIKMPETATTEVNAFLTASAALIAKYDAQSAVTTADAFKSANAATTTAYAAFTEAVSSLSDKIGALAEEESKPKTQQVEIQADYVIEEGGKQLIDDAAAWRDDLLEIGSKNAVDEVAGGSHLIVESWRAALPNLSVQLVGYGVVAPPNGLSGHTVLAVDPKESPSSKNPNYLAFAVKDRHGVCAGGVLIGYPAPDKAEKVELAEGTACSGEEVAKKAGYFNE